MTIVMTMKRWSRVPLNLVTSSPVSCHILEQAQLLDIMLQMSTGLMRVDGSDMMTPWSLKLMKRLSGKAATEQMDISSCTFINLFGSSAMLNTTRTLITILTHCYATVASTCDMNN